MSNYDIGIIGGGIAGAFAALRIAEYHSNLKTILFEFGRPPGKRRRPLEGWFGCFPTGDGKIYPDDADKIRDIADGRSVRAANRWFFQHLNEINSTKLIKSKLPDSSLQSKINKVGFELAVRNYYQWQPEAIHQLSKHIAESIENYGNVEFSFDNEVFEFSKHYGRFLVHTADGAFKCKRLILCVGRSGWRWVNKIYRDLGILVSDDVAKYGIRAEIPTQYLKEFNNAHCILSRDDVQIGPFCWNGSIIQEDHADMTTAAFRSNEGRWHTDKVFFPIIGLRDCEDKGCAQTNRLAQLLFLLSGDRVGRERIKSFMKKQDQLSLIPEYNWLFDIITELAKTEIIPQIITRGYYHYPDILTSTSKIRLESNFESEIEGLFIAGESAGISGIAAAGISGALAAENAAK